MRKYILLMLFACLQVVARGQTTNTLDSLGLPHPTEAKELRCWFDEDAANMQTTSSVAGNHLLDVSGLTDGLHTVHSQIIDSDDKACPVYSALFIKVGDNAGSAGVAQKLLYWFDEETSKKQTDFITGGQTIDASALEDGLHTLHYQVLFSNGEKTPIVSAIFLRNNFYAPPTTAQSFRYWFDDGKAAVETSVANGIQLIDASGLTEGLHLVYYQIVDSSGKLCSPMSAFFFKARPQREGPNGITRYMYWMNNRTSEKVVVNNASPVTPFQLLGLLPMQQVPIRSSCFHFEMKDNQPMVYAKNELYVRFDDADGYSIEASKPFVDYAVSQEVVPVGELQPTQTFSRVASGDIRWYTLHAEEGDTVAFKSNQACSMQLFSPSGEEVYSTSGSTSVAYGGCHVWEDGTYYLAIHDVTGSRSSMTLDYMHMDRYDVVDQDVYVVGNGGCSTITFYGNGFKNLYAVSLFTAEGDTIQHIDIGHESDATTSVTFDFNGAELGQYDALFRFSDEDKTFTNIVKVEEAVDIELATTVDYRTIYPKGSTTTYTVKVTNKGNMTAYAVPLELKLITTTLSDINKITFGGELQSIEFPEEVLADSIDAETIEIIKEAIANTSDIIQFVFYQDSTDNTCYGLSHVIVDLPPNTTCTYQVTISSKSEVQLYAYTTTEWFAITLSDEGTIGTNRRKLSPENRAKLCCYRERIECGAEIVANIVGVFLPPGAGCAVSLGMTGLEAIFDIYCEEGKDLPEKMKNYWENSKQSLISNLIQSTISCVTAYFHFKKHQLYDDRNLAASIGNANEVERINSEILALRSMEQSIIRDIYEGVCASIMGKGCYDAFKNKKPNCPPNPDGGGGLSRPVLPFDPNDIFGYTAESGSTFMSDTIQTVNYRIEFENDTTFATASAHTVVVKDTLDGKYFDLGSYAPRSVKIGEKTEYLDGSPSFVKTIDMRPEINAIAQVEGKYNAQKGIATWTFTSLDPMTMEPTDDVMQGFLPVNFDGTSGTGEVSFDIDLKKRFEDGTAIANRASIVFDTNDAIMTPTWTNIVDAVAPTSEITSIDVENDTIMTLHLVGEDNRSGIWRYNVYVQAGDEAPWWLAGENITDNTFTYKGFKGINYGFCVVATDSAGNVEPKELVRESTVTTFTLGDANGDGIVNAVDAVLAINYYLDEEHTYINFDATNVVKDGVIDAKDVVAIQQIYLNTSSSTKRKRLKYRNNEKE